MKTSLRLVFASLAFAVTLPALSADQPGKVRVLAAADTPDKKIERHIKTHRSPGPREMESVAFLGVDTAPVSAALTAQLGLPKNTGLVVREIVPDSPAAGVLQPHDILLKLDDQWLIEPRQFSVLVRNHQEGDEVTLTCVRAGKQTTAKVKLGQHEVPKLGLLDFPGDEKFDFLLRDDDPARRREHGEAMQRVLSLLDRDKLGPLPEHREMAGPPGFRAMRVNPGNSNMVYTDEHGSLELTIKDGSKSLIAKDPKGEQLFAGPVDTPGQREALPPDLLERLEELESMREFSFEPDARFQRDVKFFRPGATKIVLPLPADGPERMQGEPRPAI